MNGKSSTLKSVINLQQLEQRLGCSLDRIAKFCQKNDITELGLFGSVLREDFNPDSDVDFLVTFSAKTKISLNKLVHDYDNINIQLVWSVIQTNIPELIAQLETIVSLQEP